MGGGALAEGAPRHREPLSFTLRGCSYGYFGRNVLHGIATDFQAGEFVSVAGPNGAGKSTLLGVMAGLREGYTGSCLLNGTEVRRWRRRDFARLVSFVPQSVRLEFPFTVWEVVNMGRAPHASWLLESPEDRQAVENALRNTHALEFQSRDFRSLSGGEKQRVLLAAAIAQEPRALLLDEPATHLDIEHQRIIYRLLREQAEAGVLVIAATHDLNLAAAYSSRITLLQTGSMVADGAPAEVLRPDLLEQIFRIPSAVEQRDGRLWVRHEL